MRRNMELLRTLMLQMEDHPSIELDGFRPTVPGASEEEITYHLYLAVEDGLVTGNSVESNVGLEAVFLRRLTSKGHDFTDAARNDAVWTKTMATVKEKGGNVSVAVLTELLKKTAQTVFGIG